LAQDLSQCCFSVNFRLFQFVSNSMGFSRHAALESPCQGPDTAVPEGVSTLMIRCVPHSYSTEALLFEISSRCNMESCDMLYLPKVTNRVSNIGYAFINFSSTKDAQKCASDLSGHRWSLVQKKKCCMVAPARVQGLSENLAEYVRSSKEDRLQEGCAPIVFWGSQRLNLTVAVKAFCDASVYQELQQKRHARTQETGRLKASTPPNAPPVKLECDAEGIPRDMHPGSGTDSDHTVSSGCTGHPAKPWAPGLMCLPHWAQQDEPREVHFFRFSV